jgi:hypothetical protein
MNIEQQQQLAELTQQAVDANDITALQKIWKVIQDDLENGTLFFQYGIEWWESIVPPEIREKIE